MRRPAEGIRFISSVCCAVCGVRDAQESEKALNEQLEELIRQRRLSVMPAFIFHPPPRNQGTAPRLSNIGNGGALNVAIGPLSFAGDGERDIDISFKQLVHMPVKSEYSLVMVSHEMAALPIRIRCFICYLSRKVSPI
jgi:hypothetical protein